MGLLSTVEIELTITAVNKANGSLAEAAESLGLRVDTLRWRVHRARRLGYEVKIARQLTAAEAFARSVYEPTAEEIARRCRAFQAKWTPTEWRSHGEPESEWAPPEPGQRFQEAIVENKYAG